MVFAIKELIWSTYLASIQQQNWVFSAHMLGIWDNFMEAILSYTEGINKIFKVIIFQIPAFRNYDYLIQKSTKEQCIVQFTFTMIL